MAARLPTILPPLWPAERLLEVSMIASVAGEIVGGALTNRRPLRAVRRLSMKTMCQTGKQQSQSLKPYHEANFVMRRFPKSCLSKCISTEKSGA